MILLDPDLDPDPTPDGPRPVRRGAGPRQHASSARPAAVWSRAHLPWAERIPTPRTLNRFLTEAQQAVRLKGEVTVLLTTDAAIRKLNRQFRGKNKATDVLSFPAEGIGTEEIAGDLAISIDTARNQAAEEGHALACELKILILHGLLHLVGFDHEADEGRMARRERQLRSKLGLPQGLIERAASASETEALKGHGFSRAKKTPKKASASAAEGVQAAGKALPPRLKPRPFESAKKRKRP